MSRSIKSWYGGSPNASSSAEDLGYTGISPTGRSDEFPTVLSVCIAGRVCGLGELVELYRPRAYRLLQIQQLEARAISP